VGQVRLSEVIIMSHPTVTAVGTSLPPHYSSQEEILEAFKELWATRHFNLERLEDLHRAVLVGGRYMARPIRDLMRMERFAERNDAWIEMAQQVGEAAARAALERAGLEPRDIDHIFFVSITGLATPSIDARLVNRLGLRLDVKRTPIFGLGCLAGAAGMARAADYLRGFPGQNVLMLAVELCSLTIQKDDLSVANIIATGLFGDGAAAAVLVGGAGERSGPRVVSTRSSFYPNTERMMGWDFTDTGFKVVLSAKVPEVVRGHLRKDVDGFLAEHGLDRSQVKHWAVHTGGPKVLQAFEGALELPANALRRSWESLRQTGNLSSASVLFVLRDLLESGEAKPGDYGLLAAMGPGFCAELVLLRW
jgi:alkylresorcinol/alkylpyrone synthase